jgi:hypothetical protein
LRNAGISFTTKNIAKRLLDTPGYRTPAAALNRAAPILHLPHNSEDMKMEKTANAGLVVKRRASEGCLDTVLVNISARRCIANLISTAKN